jgi:hypothetical protein
VLDGTTPVFGCFKHNSAVYIDSSSCINACPCVRWLVSTDQDEINDLTIYPNPVKDILILNFQESGISFESYEIYSLDGSLLLNAEIEMNRYIEVDLEHLNSGVYIIKLKGKKSIISRRIFKCNSNR